MPGPSFVIPASAVFETDAETAAVSKTAAV